MYLLFSKYLTVNVTRVNGCYPYSNIRSSRGLEQRRARSPREVIFSSL